MDYDQLASFLEVAKQQSFSRAAEKLFRTQPAISAQVRLIEQECGEKLFDRSGKKVLLTPAGEILSRYAQKMIDRKSTRLNSSHGYISYAVFCLKKKKQVILLSRLDK